MINIGVGGLKRAVAVKNIGPAEGPKVPGGPQPRPPFRFQKKFVKVGNLADDFEVLLTDVARPGATDKITNQRVELAKTLDGPASWKALLRCQGSEPLDLADDVQYLKRYCRRLPHSPTS